jgi:hypothetical protein
VLNKEQEIDICRILKENNAAFLVDDFWKSCNQAAHLDIHSKPHYKNILQNAADKEENPTFRENLKQMIANSFKSINICLTK